MAYRGDRQRVMKPIIIARCEEDVRAVLPSGWQDVLERMGIDCNGLICGIPVIFSDYVREGRVHCIDSDVYSKERGGDSVYSVGVLGVQSHGRPR